MTPFYRQQIKQAEQLTDQELERHALVSIQHRCHCNECFCCACAHVQSVRKREQVQLRRMRYDGSYPLKGDET